jgi:hypothetical protein
MDEYRDSPMIIAPIAPVIVSGTSMIDWANMIIERAKIE